MDPYQENRPEKTLQNFHASYGKIQAYSTYENQGIEQQPLKETTLADNLSGPSFKYL